MGQSRMALRTVPVVELPTLFHVSPQGGVHGKSSTTRPAMEGSMNPLDSITGTIVSGVILAFVLAALF